MVNGDAGEEEDMWVEKVAIGLGAEEEEVGPLPLFVPGSKGVGKNALVFHPFLQNPRFES